MKTSSLKFGPSASVLALVFGAAVSVGIVATAQAGETLGSRSRSVTFADLNLASPAGAAAAYERVHQMARQLCSKVSDRDDLSRQQNYVACINAAMAKVGPQVADLIRQKSSVVANAVSVAH